MSMSLPPRNRRGFKVAIICALPLEAENVRCMFDKCWEDEDKYYGKAVGDQNAYTTGVIGKLNVVLAHMPGIGNTNAAAVAAGLRSSFLGIQLALVVGICGVVPVHTETQEEIVLGDIIISTAMIQYDFGRQYPNGFHRKNKTEDSLGRASPEIRSFMNMLQARQNHKRLTRNLTQLIKSEDFQREVPDANYPGAIRDQLYETSYIHQHRPGASCDKCNNDNILETCSKNCDELECEEGKLIIRNRHSFPKTKDLALLSDDTRSVHFGRFGSANSVMKSGMDRDRVANVDEVIAFEMEGAGVWDQHPTVVIKGACDYADSHKNKDWQAYAAATAAACLKVFLKEWAVPDQPNDRDELSSPLWHIPFDRMQGFVGRTDELKHLKQKISETDSRRIMSILGLGGVGKSRLALELAYQIQSEHPQNSIFWIQAAERLTFERDILEIGKKLGIAGIEDDKADIKNLVKQRLSDPLENKWFLILDNADDETLWVKQSNISQQESTLVDYLPRTTNGSIIITTRVRRVANFLAGKKVIDLHEMSPDEGAKMFTDALEEADLVANRTNTLNLVEKLAYLPLAIVQAASFINKNQEPVETYLRLLDQTEEDVIELLSKDFDEPSGYQRVQIPVATTWLISFEQIRKHHPLAAKCLASMACLHEKNIPLSLLPEASSNHVIDAMAVLVGYSFVRKQTGDICNAHEPLYDMHRLVHLTTRNWLRMEGSLADETVACLRRVEGLFPTRDHKHKETWTFYMPHGQRLCADSYIEECPERYDLLEKMGLCSMIDGRYREAVKMHFVVMQWREHKLGTLELQTLDAYENLGEALNWSGDWSTAEEYLHQALEGHRETLGQEHPSTLNSMANLASTVQNQGRWKEAEELEVQVMETMKRVLGVEHPDTLTSMDDLASTFWNQGRWKEAEELGVQVIETRKRVLGAEHPSTLTSLGNLASIFQHQGQWKEAEELEVQVMETRKRVLGPEHPDTLTNMANLASTFHNQGRWKEAEELGVQVMETMKRVLGVEHPDTLTSMNNLASAFQNQGRWKEAEELGVQVMETMKRVLGVEHPDTLASMNNLACTLKHQNRDDEAIALMFSCLDPCLRVFGPAHDHTQAVRNTIMGWLNAGRFIG